MIREFIKYVLSFIKVKKDSVDIVIVRRYKTPVGYNGELYVNGKQIGMSCDNVIGGVEVRDQVSIGFENNKRVLRNHFYVISNGDFTLRLDYNKILVGSLEKDENNLILARLIDQVQSAKLIRLIILNRLWVEA